MTEKLMNVQEVCRYLGLAEQDLRKLVDRGEIPAYRLGGTILRFRKDQVDRIKARGLPQIAILEEKNSGGAEASRLERWRDFLYFNDFYIISVLIVVILVAVILIY